MKLDQGIAVIVGVIAAGVLFALSLGWGLPAPVPQWQQSYACGEFVVNISLSNDFGILYVEGVGDPLLYIPGDSGALYQNDMFSFFFQGESLTIVTTETGIVLAQCDPVLVEDMAPLNFGD